MLRIPFWAIGWDGVIRLFGKSENYIRKADGQGVVFTETGLGRKLEILIKHGPNLLKNFPTFVEHFE